MKKKLIMLLLSCALVLQACSAQNLDIDPKELAVSLRETVAFQDELSLVDEDMAEKLYGIDNFTEAYVYVGSGATAEEIAVFEFDSLDETEKAAGKARERIDQQKEDFASYIPEETARLDNAVIKQAGNYLAVCVSGGGSAHEVIEEYLG